MHPILRRPGGRTAVAGAHRSRCCRACEGGRDRRSYRRRARGMAAIARAPRYTALMDKFGEMFEQFKVQGKDLADKVRELIHEGNVRRIIIRDEQGHTYMEIPVTVAALGIILAPVLAAIGALAALVARFAVVVERSPHAPAPPATSTEEKTNV